MVAVGHEPAHVANFLHQTIHHARFRATMTPPMKTVLVDLTSLNTSQRQRGVGRHIRELAAGLACLDDADRGPLRIIGAAFIPIMGDVQVTEDLAGFDGSPLIRNATLIDDHKTRWQRRFGMWRAVRHVGADLVHLPDPDATPVGLKLLQTPRIITCHDLHALRTGTGQPVSSRAAASGRRRVASRRFLDADHVIAISSYTADDLRAQLGLEASRVSVVYNGVDLSRWVSCADLQSDGLVLSTYGLHRGAYALFVGGAAWRKNRDGMLRGLRHARELRPDIGLQLAWAGRLTARESSVVDQTARDLGIRHAVHLLGYVPDRELAALYRNAAAHVLVSRYEGFGLTMVEAMACGCPVITTRRTALAEVAGDAAVDVDPEDADAIGEALVRVATDPVLRADLSHRGLARAALFSRERQARETAAIYRRLLGV